MSTVNKQRSNYIDPGLELLSDLKTQWIITVFGFLILSIFFGVYPSRRPLLSTGLWLLCALLGLICIWRAFPNVWKYSFWLLALYITAIGGWIFIFVFTSKLYIPLGIILEILSYAIGIYFIYHIRSVRDQNIETYVPLGLWSLCIILFWFFSLFSIRAWYIWAKGTGALIEAWGYIFSEVVLVIILIYILWVLDRKFERIPEPLIVADLQELPGVLPKLKRRKVPKTVTKQPDRCPICNTKLIPDSRECRSCGNVRTFYWCKVSETYIIMCPHCNAPTSYGKERCRTCKKPIGQLIKCTCGEKKPIKSWKKRSSRESWVRRVENQSRKVRL